MNAARAIVLACASAILLPCAALAGATHAWQQALTTGPDWARVEKLLGFGQDPNVLRQSDGRTALSIAAEQGQGTAMRQLLTRGARVKRGSGDPGPFHHAIRQGRIAETELLYAAMTPDERKREWQASILADDEAAALELLRLGERADAVLGATPVIHLATRQGMLELVRQLVARGAPLDGLSERRHSVIQEAVYALHPPRSYELVRMLLRAGASVSALDPSVDSALSMAVERRDAPLVDLLLDAGASVSVASVSRRCKPLRCLFKDGSAFSLAIALRVLSAAIQQKAAP